MKFSEKWLREWVNPKISATQLAHQLTMAGLEVDACDPVAPALDKVVVGQVTDLQPHPDADKLRVCQVNMGENSPLSIVCGASNVEINGVYPVALIGAQLPGGFKIKKAKLRGVESFGMLCSTAELGMAEQADGLMPLPQDAPIGKPIMDYLEFDDNSIELGLTPNRADCLSISGVAREVGVINKIKVTPPTIKDPGEKIKDQFPVDIQAPDHCPRYVGRIIKGIDANAATPIWIQERLRRSGLRSISPVVDVTNFVLLELGQPMHGFDLNKLDQGIVVRLAEQGEKITLLDGQEITLEKGALVIGDHKQAQALAGIMGGNDAAVTETTKDIFLESAYFSPSLMAGRARSYGLHTDSSHRFERGVDPQLQRKAVERASQLLIEIVGGKAGPIVDIAHQKHIPKQTAITVRSSRLKKVLGVNIDKETVTDILKRLDMDVKPKAEAWQVTPPSFRFDIEREVDLIEEVARIYGYNQIPNRNPNATAVMNVQTERKISLTRFREALVQGGYQEAITYSFVDPKLANLVDPENDGLQLANPISTDMSIMRTSLWPGLLQVAVHNLNRQQENVRLFETGLRFLPQNDDIIQEPMLAGLHCGRAYPEQWGMEQRMVDFFDVKNTINSLLKLTGEADRFIYLQDKHLALHPGQTARIVRKVDERQEIVGWLGALHPAIAQKLDITQPLYLFEMRLSSIGYRELPKFHQVSKFPAIRRDMAVVVDENLTAQTVIDCIKHAAPKTLTNLQLFDVYSGKGIDSGRKSLAFGLTLQREDQTLTDEEVESVFSDIMSILNKELGATLRE